MTREPPGSDPIYPAGHYALPVAPGRAHLGALFTSPGAFFSVPHRFEEATGWAVAAIGLVGALVVAGESRVDMLQSLGYLEAFVGSLGGALLVLVVTLHVVLKFVGAKGTFEDTYTVLVFVGSAALAAFLVPLASVRLTAGPATFRALQEVLPWVSLALGGTVLIWSCIAAWTGLLRVHEVGPSTLGLALLVVLAPIIARLGVALSGCSPDGPAVLLTLVLPLGIVLVLGLVYVTGLLISLRSVS